VLVVGDPIEELQSSVRTLLEEEEPGTLFDAYGEISKNVRWRPHLVQREIPRGWYFHPCPPETDTWARRADAAKQADGSLRVGVASDLATLEDSNFLLECARLDAAVIVLREKRGRLTADEFFSTFADFICEKRIKLAPEAVREVLDLLLSRALAEVNDQKKGVKLEVLCAVLMSQVDGFETRSKGVSNRTQQMDVLVHNRVNSGALAGSPLVLVEAKNWPTTPISPDEYAIFERKISTRHRRCKLGLLITTGRFTKGVGDERRRDSRDDTMIALVDGKSLPRLWRGRRTITEEVEELVVDSLVGD
jgi:hypothetical protein